MTHTTELDPIVKATLTVVQAFHELRLLTPMIPELQRKFDPLAEAIRKLTEEVDRR